MKNTNKIGIPSYEDLITQAMGQKSASTFLQDGFRFGSDYALVWGVETKTANRRLDGLCRIGKAEKADGFSAGRMRKMYRLL